MILSAASMVNVSAATNETAATHETTAITEPTIPATEGTTANEENIYKHFTYSVKGKAVTITKYNGSAKSVKIPSEIDGKKVRIIGKKAFMVGDYGKNKTLEAVTIPDSVYEIKAYAFYNCVNLSKITTGKNVKKIGESAFRGCKNLKEFKIPSKVTKLNYDVFTHTGIKSLHIGKNVKNISSSSFHNMANKPLKKITVSKKNKYYSSQDGVLYNKKKTKLILCPPSLNKKSLTLPSSLKTIDSYAIHNNKNLQTVKLQNKLKTIGECAFLGCKNLKEISIPKSVSIIDEYAFAGCAKLTNITILNKDTTVETYAFGNCGFKSVEVSHEISEGYWSCKNLQKVTILPNVTSIGSKQFFNCPKLKTVTIPSTVKTIFNKAFGFQYKTVDGSLKIVKVKGFTIKGKKNTAAHRYAKKHGFKFVETN